MNKYIEQNVIIETFRKYCPNPTDLGNAQHFINIIKNIPAANVRPVVRGEWFEPDDDYGYLVCSVCEERSPNDERWCFCPNCGADMRRWHNG